MALSGQGGDLRSPESEPGHFECWMDPKCEMAFIWEKPFKRDVHNYETFTCKLNGAPCDQERSDSEGVNGFPRVDE